ncbi:2-hydroxychromene-2-carboxylate isomerase [Massilia pseudoviolaceinigra]|uniref:2-hydroxychromene-2-carboxylate isomerase n=1 Tax=Massilia pseudoviolaceinigra TaxID=3057165 RepID=UPI002796D42F|nr:2-hydroxychromene-2-carboxylate isomerase [Massilia sp. CCM 9206]MDQ1922951.1 2-hydroxychromene-2-carboxylate isomerase [Massilia sp. CCM 9206]
MLTNDPQIEFWFDFGSNYSYLSTMRIEALAAAQGVRVRWKPFLLGPVFKTLGWSTSPFVLQKEKGTYVWRDMQRQCDKYGLPWTQPGTFPRRALLPLRVALLGAGEAWIGAFCRRIMQCNFVEDREIDDAALVGEVLTALGLDADALIAGAGTDANKLAMRAQGEQAMRRGVFGAPMFFAGDEMFWGNDRLEDALAWAAGHVAPRIVLA